MGGFLLSNLPGSILLHSGNTEHTVPVLYGTYESCTYLPTVFGGPIVLAAAPSPKNRIPYDKRVNERNQATKCCTILTGKKCGEKGFSRVLIGKSVRYDLKLFF
jgi:hypothetical protein